MIVTQSDARNIIRAVYGRDFKFRLTTACTIGVRPVSDTLLGQLTLAWRKFAVDRNGDAPSVVRIGRVLPGGSIDWDAVISLSGPVREDYSIASETHEGPDPDLTMALYQTDK